MSGNLPLASFAVAAEARGDHITTRDSSEDESSDDEPQKPRRRVGMTVGVSRRSSPMLRKRKKQSLSKKSSSSKKSHPTKKPREVDDVHEALRLEAVRAKKKLDDELAVETAKHNKTIQEAALEKARTAKISAEGNVRTALVCSFDLCLHLRDFAAADGCSYGNKSVKNIRSQNSDDMPRSPFTGGPLFPLVPDTKKDEFIKDMVLSGKMEEHLASEHLSKLKRDDFKKLEAKAQEGNSDAMVEVGDMFL